MYVCVSRPSRTICVSFAVFPISTGWEPRGSELAQAANVKDVAIAAKNNANRFINPQKVLYTKYENLRAFEQGDLSFLYCFM